MCRVCEYIERAKRITTKEIQNLEHCQSELLTQQQNILDPLIEIISYIYPKDISTTTSFGIKKGTLRQRSSILTEIILLIKENLQKDLKKNIEDPSVQIPQTKKKNTPKPRFLFPWCMLDDDNTYWDIRTRHNKEHKDYPERTELIIFDKAYDICHPRNQLQPVDLLPFGFGLLQIILYYLIPDYLKNIWTELLQLLNLTNLVKQI